MKKIYFMYCSWWDKHYYFVPINTTLDNSIFIDSIDNKNIRGYFYCLDTLYRTSTNYVDYRIDHIEYYSEIGEINDNGTKTG